MTPALLLFRMFGRRVMELNGVGIVFSVTMSVLCLSAAIYQGATKSVPRVLALFIIAGAGVTGIGGIYGLFLAKWQFTQWLSIFTETLLPIAFLNLEHHFISNLAVFLVTPLLSLVLPLFCRWSQSPEAEGNIFKRNQRAISYTFALLWLLIVAGWFF